MDGQPTDRKLSGNEFVTREFCFGCQLIAATDGLKIHLKTTGEHIVTHTYATH